MTDEPTKKEAIELAEDFTDWMGASWPMFGGINATAKLADMASKRFKTAERLAKIEAADRAVYFYERDCGGCGKNVWEKCDECSHTKDLRAAILGNTIKEGKTDAEKLAIAVKALENISGRGMTGGGIAKRALKEIQ